MKFDLSNKNALITGGSRGIGKGIATEFARQGAHVYILDIDENEAEKTALEIRERGGAASWFSCNVESPAEVRATFQKVIEAGGTIDILVNNAGISHIGTVESTTDEDVDRIVAVNIKGVYHCMHVAVSYMKKQGKGVILNLASVVASVGIPDRFAYSMSKGAVVAMTLSVARDYLADNIRCNCISPGRVHTPFVDNYLAQHYPGREKEMFEKLAKTQPMGRIGTPREMADLALYLCSDEAAFITGNNYAIDGGFISLK